MKRANELVPAASRQMTVSDPGRQIQAVADDVQAGQMINDLIRELRAIFPAWKQAWPTAKHQDLAKVTWTKAIIEAGISDWSMIERGLRWCRSLGTDFMPSAGKFMQHCWPGPEELGLPEAESAFWEACRYSHPAMAGKERWSHPAVYHAAIKCSRHSLLSLPADTGRLKFQKAYQEVCRDISRGVTLQDPPKALPSDVQRKGDPAKAAEALAAMRRVVAGSEGQAEEAKGE